MVQLKNVRIAAEKKICSLPRRKHGGYYSSSGVGSKACDAKRSETQLRDAVDRALLDYREQRV